MDDDDDDDGVCVHVFSLCNKSLVALYHLLLAFNKASQLLPSNSLCFGILPTLVNTKFLMGLGQGNTQIYLHR
jgi:hypothetical protein